jgi:hypothetical protein
VSTNRKIFEIAFFLFLCIGIYGAAWIQIDWDIEKLFLYTYIGLPLAFLYYFLSYFFPTWIQFEKTRITLVATLFIVFLLGNVLWINAVTTESVAFKRDIVIGGDRIRISNYSGGLGINYHRRW